MTDDPIGGSVAAAASDIGVSRIERRAVDAAIFDAIDTAVVVIDPDRGVEFWNAATERLFGYEPGSMRKEDLAQAFADEQRRAAGPHMYELVIRTASGETRRVRLSNSSIRLAEGSTKVVAVVDDVTAQEQARDDADRYADRLRRLARVTGELATARDVDTVVEIAVAHAAQALGATISTLSMLEGETLRLIGMHGGKEETGDKWATYPLSAETPAADAMRTKQPVILVGRAAIVARYPVFGADVPDERSVVCLPLIVRERALGAVGLVFAGCWAPDDRELEFMMTFADTCAQALDRLEALELARSTAAKLAFLADASAELASSLDYRATLANVARLAVPTLADWCAVDIVEDGQLRTLAVAHVDPAKVAMAEELQRQYPRDLSARGGIADVVRTGRSQWVPQVTDEMLVAAARDEEHLRLARELHLQSAVIVPLIARDRVLGALTLVSAESGHVYDEADVKFAEDLARRAAIAIDNAQLHSETREAAVRLQHAVLPERLPHVPGWEMAAYYRSAGRTEVGGDFYDAIPAGDGNVAVVVGDVMGRGVAAAAAMAQMRAAVRAYAALDPRPQKVLESLDRLFSTDEIAQLVTLVYCLTDHEAGELTIVNAGHLPPLRVVNGSAELLRIPASLPLGVEADARTVVTIPFPPGSTLIGFTDGLVERRSEDIGVGLNRLRQRAALLGDVPLRTQLEMLVDSMCERDAHAEVARSVNDDVTLLALRRATA